MKKYFFVGSVISNKQEEHRHITKSEDFVVVGGSKDEHDQLTEKVIKINEKVKDKDIAPEKLDSIVEEEMCR